MKRFHVHVNVDNLDTSVRFYSNLFGTDPVVREPDYAKWMLDDPRVNFAISQRGHSVGIDHLGLQAESADELDEIGARLAAAGTLTFSEIGTTCCYANSDKHWTEDPQGVRWESFRTLSGATTYAAPTGSEDSDACCGPSKQASASSGTAAAGCCGPRPGTQSCCD